MNFLDQWIAKFGKLALRERLMTVAAIAALMYFAMNFALLDPQQKKIKELQRQDELHKTELAALDKVLADMGGSAAKANAAMGADAKIDQATLDELKKQVAVIDAILGQSDATASQVDTLAREMLKASPRLTLVSLKTLPVTPFYTPPANKDANKDAGGDKLTTTGTTTGTNAAPANEGLQNPIYRHGVEVSVKGDYMALMSYLDNLQKYPKRLFWADAKLDAAYPDTVLNVVIYTLSEQPKSPLR